MVDNQDFPTEFQSCFHAIYLRCFRRLSSESERITPQTLGVLAHLANIGPATVQELATHFGRAQSTVTEIVDRLQSNGLVDRMPDERDRRRIFIWLTKQGRAKLQEATTPLDPTRVSTLAENLTDDEQATFLALFTKLTKGENHEL